MSFWEGYDFWRDWMLAVWLAAALCGYLGVYVVLRRIVFVGAALTQVSMLGITSSLWLASVLGEHAGGHTWHSPEIFSLGAAVLVAVFFAFLRGGGKLASETVVGVVWAVASALVLVLLSTKHLAAEKHEIEDALYGAAVPSLHQVKVLGVVAASILAVHLLFFKELLFVTYDAEMAQTLGYRTRLWDVLLYVTLGVGVSFSVRTLGGLPVFGLLVVPAAAAQLVAARAIWMFVLAVLFSLTAGSLGFYVAWTRQYETGASIVAIASLFLIPGMVRRVLRRQP